MLTPQHRLAWEQDGFFVLKGFLDADVGRAMEREAVSALRADPPSAHSGERAYRTVEGLYVQPEAKPVEGAVEAEDHVSKVFNTHLAGTAHDFAVSHRCGDIVSSLLDADVDVFQSMFILKNPGSWGQPWHQDSYYFNFDQQPQIGLWLAISEATLENGCLSVIPGSHRLSIQRHNPDPRPGANHGYLEIPDVDDSAATPVLMEPGDLLVFHSHLLHKSVDNLGRARRSAMVYHYGRAGSVNLASPETQVMQNAVTRWIPVTRRSKAA